MYDFSHQNENRIPKRLIISGVLFAASLVAILYGGSFILP